jgi:hypothetical protein
MENSSKREKWATPSRKKRIAPLSQKLKREQNHLRKEQ